MSKESLDYEKLCSNYYSSWEDGSCMESCEFYNHNECPVVYVNGLLEERDKTIADLEAKLAESEEERDSNYENYSICWKENTELKQQLAEEKEKNTEYINMLWNRKWAKKYNEMRRAENPKLLFPDADEVYERYFKQKDKIEELEKQLAEKEKEIEYYKKQAKKFNNEAQKYYEDAYCNDFHNQDKISFAVEQLAKVKASIEVRLVIIQENYTDDLYTEKEYLDMTVENENILKKIDNQIKAIKGENK